MIQKIKFPIIAYPPKKKTIFYSESLEDLTLVSKGKESYLLELEIIDSDGNTFQINQVTNLRRAGFISSFKYLQPMYRLDINCEAGRQLSIEEVKQFILDKTKGNNNYSALLGSRKDLVDFIEREDIRNVYRLFR